MFVGKRVGWRCLGAYRKVCRGGQRVLAGLMSVVLVLAASGTAFAARSKPNMEFQCEEYNACYFNPADDGCGTGGPTGLALGDDPQTQVWNYFATAGIEGVSDNAGAIAGIMGNFEAESGFDPFVVNSTGHYGIFQAGIEWYKALVDEVNAAGLEQYWHGGGGDPGASPPDAVTKGIQIELDYLTKKASNWGNYVSRLGEISDKTNAEAYARLFENTVEISGEDNMEGRMSAARKYYEMFGDSTVASLSGSSSRGSSSNVSSDGWIEGIEGLQKEDARGRADLRETPAGEFATSDNKAHFVVLHYTAGSSNNGLATYGTNMFPAHFTIDLKKRTAYQHFPLSEPSLAVSTYDGYAIQIEIVGIGYSDWGVDPTSDYNLANFGDDEWDYLAYFLNAIHEYTGIPLESSVAWNNPERNLSGAAAFNYWDTHKMSDAEVRSYKGVLAHMHLPNNPGKADAGDIWDQVKAALERNPSSGYSSGCYDSGSGSGGGLVSGGMNKEQADAFMKEYIDLQAQYANTPAGTYVSEYDLYTTNCAPSGALGNCVAFSQYFVNRYSVYYSQHHWIHTVNGVDVVNTLLSQSISNGFTDGGSTPKPYAIFSYNNHTGVVLGMDEANDYIIIGEAGCQMGDDWTGAHDKTVGVTSRGKQYGGITLSGWQASHPGIRYAYTDGALIGI